MIIISNRKQTTPRRLSAPLPRHRLTALPTLPLRRRVGVTAGQQAARLAEPPNRLPSRLMLIQPPQSLTTHLPQVRPKPRTVPRQSTLETRATNRPWPRPAASQAKRQQLPTAPPQQCSKISWTTICSNWQETSRWTTPTVPGFLAGSTSLPIRSPTQSLARIRIPQSLQVTSPILKTKVSRDSRHIASLILKTRKVLRSYESSIDV